MAWKKYFLRLTQNCFSAWNNNVFWHGRKMFLRFDKKIFFGIEQKCFLCRTGKTFVSNRKNIFVLFRKKFVSSWKNILIPYWKTFLFRAKKHLCKQTKHFFHAEKYFSNIFCNKPKINRNVMTRLAVVWRCNLKVTSFLPVTGFLFWLLIQKLMKTTFWLLIK